MRGLVHCDYCHHEFSSDDVGSWHMRACPECRNGPLISDADLETIQAVDTLEAIGLLRSLAHGEKPPADALMTVTINTAALRENNH